MSEELPTETEEVTDEGIITDNEDAGGFKCEKCDETFESEVVFNLHSLDHNAEKLLGQKKPLSKYGNSVVEFINASGKFFVESTSTETIEMEEIADHVDIGSRSQNLMDSGKKDALTICKLYERIKKRGRSDSYSDLSKSSELYDLYKLLNINKRRSMYDSFFEVGPDGVSSLSKLKKSKRGKKKEGRTKKYAGRNAAISTKIKGLSTESTGRVRTTKRTEKRSKKFTRGDSTSTKSTGREMRSRRRKSIVAAEENDSKDDSVSDDSDDCTVVVDGPSIIAKITRDQLFNCNFCLKTFTSKLQYVDHMRLHTGDRLRCEKCGETFVTDAEKKRHDKIHVERIIYTCEKCSREFSSVMALEMHELDDHEPEHEIQRWECKTCLQTFGRKKTLQGHMRIHIKEESE